jgi:excisionase family DNA binding protein
MDRLLTIREAAVALALSPSTIRKMLWQGRPPKVKVARSTRIREGDVEALIRLEKPFPAGRTSTTH